MIRQQSGVFRVAAGDSGADDDADGLAAIERRRLPGRHRQWRGCGEQKCQNRRLAECRDFV
jgi:hypothetical protein